MRVTDKIIDRTILHSISQNLDRLEDLTRQMASGRRVEVMSDDISAVSQILRLQRRGSQLAGYLENIQSVDNVLSIAASQLERASSSMTRIKELAIQSATGTYADTEREAMAQEVDQILQGLIGLAMAQANGAYVFGGQATSTAPFSIERDEWGSIQGVAYQGGAVSTRVNIEPGRTTEINFVGSDVFESDGSLFDTIIGLRDAMRAGGHEGISDLIDDLDVAHRNITVSLGTMGARQSELQVTRYALERFQGLNTQFISDNQDADIAKLSVEYGRRMTLLQMVMKVAAQSVSASLLDFF